MIQHQASFQQFNNMKSFWLAALAVWLIAMCILPDPRPLSAPDWSIRIVQSLIGQSEPKSRFVAAIILRTLGIGMIGVLTAMSVHAISLSRSAAKVLIAAPLLSVGVKWINFAYFPIREQLFFIVTVAILGGLLGLAVCRNRNAAIALVSLVALLFVWGTSTRVPEDLERAARAIGQHLLENSSEIASGDEAFNQLLRMAFSYAEENSHGNDAVFPNKAAILALGVVMGDDQIVRVGRSEIDPERKAERESLRRKVTVHGRGDLPRHFAVSAALVILADEGRSLAVGIAKEVSDSNPGGSGFSFVDMVANKSGIRLAALATQNSDSARKMQTRVAKSEGQYRFVPEIDDLPEGLSSEVFQAQFGGLGGTRTRDLMAEIDRRVNEVFEVH